MVEYKCNKCNKVWIHKGSYNRHINRKNPCLDIPNSTNQKPTSTNQKQTKTNQQLFNTCKMGISNECEYCSKQFTHKNSLYRHIKHRCSVKIEQEIEEEKSKQKIIIFEDSIKELKEEVKILKKKSKSKKVINNIVNNIGNTTNNIAITAFGEEDMDTLDDKDIIKALMRGFFSTAHLINEVHFNPKHPQFQTRLRRFACSNIKLLKII